MSVLLLLKNFLGQRDDYERLRLRALSFTKLAHKITQS